LPPEISELTTLDTQTDVTECITTPQKTPQMSGTPTLRALSASAATRDCGRHWSQAAHSWLASVVFSEYLLHC